MRKCAAEDCNVCDKNPSKAPISKQLDQVLFFIQREWSRFALMNPIAPLRAHVYPVLLSTTCPLDFGIFVASSILSSSTAILLLYIGMALCDSITTRLANKKTSKDGIGHCFMGPKPPGRLELAQKPTRKF
jgi:hypothetical protein